MYVQEYGEETRECEAWIYDTSEFRSSAVAEFDMVCLHAWKRTLAQVAWLYNTIDSHKRL